jgi:hypothetical protein
LIIENSLFFKKMARGTADKPSGGLRGLSGGHFDGLKIAVTVSEQALNATYLIVIQQGPDLSHRNADWAF